MKRDDFIAALQKTVWPTGYDPKMVFIHCQHESGNFPEDNPLVKANNYAGIKVPQKWTVWTGRIVRVLTHEYINGVKTEVWDNFCGWQTPEDFLNYYYRFIQSVYPAAYIHRDDYKQYYAALQGHYATDPNYASQLIKAYEASAVTFTRPIPLEGLGGIIAKVLSILLLLFKGRA